MSHNKLNISKFGVFHVKTTKNRIGRNPKTKKEYNILSSKRLSFTPSNYSKKFIN